MQVTCYPKQDIESCFQCKDRKRCEIYWLVMDLTAERDICPLDKTKEYCPVLVDHR